jgi:hypothetical protein
MTIKKKKSPSTKEIDIFLEHANFELPDGFIDFFSQANGAEIFNGKDYIILWPLTEMIKLNQDYKVSEYANAFFIFGSDGGDTAYCIEKKTGYIFDMPFIGMSNEDAVFRYKSFKALLDNYN